MSLSLTLSDRLHEIIRQTSIKTIYDALVELLTNCDDAYRSLNIAKKDIWVEIVRNNLTSLIVTDQAKGMSYEEMINNLLTVGNYTAGDSSRGMMGRGAKDCSFLGDITFTCIKDGKLNQLVIYQNRKADILQKDVEVTFETRLKYSILNNGCSVELKVDSSLVPEIKEVAQNLANNIYLRNILSNNTVILLLKEGEYNQRLRFEYPPRKLIVSCDYDIPEYNTSAHFELYRYDAELPFQPKADLLNYGIVVGSNNSIYECSALYHIGSKIQDYMWNTNIRLLSGVLICNDIDKIAREAANGNINDKNPFLLIDPNRRAGLAKDHPFTVALYTHAYHLLTMVIDRMQDHRDDKMMENGNASDVFNSLNDMLSELLPSESVLYTWRTKEDHESMAKIIDSIKNVNLDSDFLGLTWEEMQQLAKDKYLQVKSSDVSGNSFKISFTNDTNVKTPYQVIYLPGKTSLKINANDPSIKNYVEIKNDTVNMVNTGKALTSVGAILVEATNNMIVRRNIMAGKTSVLDINSYNEFIYHMGDARQSIAPNIFSKISSGINALK